MSAEFWILVGIYRNTWNRLEWLEIFSEVRVGYRSGLFTAMVFSGRYGKNEMELIILNQT